MAFGAPAHPRDILEPGPIEPKRNQQQFEIVAFVRQSAAGVSYALRLFRDTVLLRQIKRSEYYVPKGKLDTVIAGIPVSFGNLGGMMPAVHFGGHEQIVQYPSFYVAAAM